MRNDDHDEVVVDAADAVTLNQDVQWDRCARLATPAGRGALAKLRSLSRAFAGGHAAEHAPLNSAATRMDPYAGVFVRRFLAAIIAIAAVDAAAGLLLLPWAWGDYHRAHGDLAVWLTTLFVSHVATAGLLLYAGRRDQRTWLLAVYFLVKATLAPLHMIQAFLWEIPPAAQLEAFMLAPPEPNRLFGYLYVHPFLFAPAFLWAFARECPRVQRRTRLDDLARRMVPGSVVLGCALWVACAAALELAWSGYAEGEVFVVLDATFAIVHLSELAAVAVIALRAPTAPADEARRVVLFSGAFLLYVGLVVAYDVVEVFSPGYWLANYRWNPYVRPLELFRFPGMVLLWYSVLAVRVPPLREVVRASYRRLLMRGLLGAVAAAPAVALVWLLASRPERTVGAVIADPLAQSLAAATGLMWLVVAYRERILIRLDAWVYPETTDQQQALAAATTALARAAWLEPVSRTVTGTVNRACGSPATLLVATGTEPDAHDFSAPDRGIAPLARGSAIVHMLETVGGSLRVNPYDATSVFALLPPDDAAWVAETGADAVVAVPGPGAELIGILVVGGRGNDRIVRPVDIPFLETLASAAGLAIARLRPLHAPAARPLDAPPACECPACGCVAAAGEPPGCGCASVYVGTDMPRLLAGKFRLTRRLGSGGMGAVYVARDVQLQRDVAVKTLSGKSVPRLLGLKPEAWAMATVAHAGVAQIYGIESWRGRPFLVVEFLASGTLEDQLRRGPVPAPRAVSVTARLAAALAAVHEAGYLHGDIKPSNIGFTSDGVPKLLDFGLAREADDATRRGGTPHYASPEVLSGRRAGEADDVWSLCVVLYEMVAGRHPFAGTDIDEVTDRILRQRIRAGGPSAAGSEPPSAAVGFAASMLTAAPSSRPATAGAFGDALHRILGPGH